MYLLVTGILFSLVFFSRLLRMKNERACWMAEIDTCKNNFIPFVFVTVLFIILDQDLSSYFSSFSSVPYWIFGTIVQFSDSLISFRNFIKLLNLLRLFLPLLCLFSRYILIKERMWVIWSASFITRIFFSVYNLNCCNFLHAVTLVWRCFFVSLYIIVFCRVNASLNMKINMKIEDEVSHNTFLLYQKVFWNGQEKSLLFLLFLN